MKKILMFCSLIFAMVFLAGTRVYAEKISILGVWGGPELDHFLEALKPFEERTGHTIEFEGTRDLNAIFYGFEWMGEMHRIWQHFPALES